MASDPNRQAALRDLNRPRRLATLRAISALMLREMTTTYGRSPLGYLWALLQPIGGIVLLTLVFSALLRSPPIGKSFVLFYATGIMPYLLYQEVSSKLSAAIQFSKQLLVYPSVTLIDALIARFTLNYLTHLLVIFIVFVGILQIFETQAVINLPAVALSLTMAGALCIGIGVMNAFLMGIMPSWVRVWAVLNRPMFLISGAFFLYEDIPEPYRGYLWYNPLVHVIAQMRRGFYPYYEAAYVSYTYVFALSAVLTVLGLIFLRRYTLEILNN